MVTLPERPPFVLRARIATPLASGALRDERDGILVVDEGGRIAWVGAWHEWHARGGRVGPAAIRPGGPASMGNGLPRVLDLRPWLILPGLVDLHAHLPQIPSAGVGAGMDLLTWLERCIFPLERAFDEPAAERLAPAAFRALAAAGTTTVVAYAAIYEGSTDVAFRAADAHGIRAIIGQVLMDRLTYDDRGRTESELRDGSLRESDELCARWNGHDSGRLAYAFTPRFGVSCSAELLRESAALAARHGAWWQTHLAEDRRELAEVGRLFPEARDYLDVYDRARALGPRAMLAHAIHLSDREMRRLAESGARVAHCPASNLFLSSGLMPLARYLDAGVVVGLGSDVAAGPDLSIFSAMRSGADTQAARRAAGLDATDAPALAPADWLRLATLDGARALGLDGVIGSIEPGREADLIVVDPAVTEPIPDSGVDELDAILSRLMYRSRPGMVRGAWVRGRCLAGPNEATPSAARA